MSMDLPASADRLARTAAAPRADMPPSAAMRRGGHADGDIGIIGGGWAGMAAALDLAQAGHRVHVLEAAPVLGGRARRVARQHPKVAGELDNGQHLLLGAYRHTLDVIRRAGVDPDSALLRLPLQMAYADGWALQAARLPAPLHLLGAGVTARGIPWAQRLSLARVLGGLKGEDASARGRTVSAWLAGTAPELLDRLWYPLCIAALNTPPDEADAEVFRNVLRDSLTTVRSDSDMLVPRIDLSRLFPEAAAQAVQRAGGTVQTAAPVQAIARTAQGWQLSTSQRTLSVSRLVIATAPRQAARLLAALDDAALQDTVQALEAFTYVPIVTLYLNVDRLRLPRPFLALDASPGAPGQFVFDRAALAAPPAGADNVWSVVVSAADDSIALPQAELAQRVRRQLTAQLAPVLPRAAVLEEARGEFVIAEKLATFRCSPGLDRPGNATGVPGLALAGDYTAGPYPATIEAAVRSGSAAAAELMRTTASRR